MEIYDHIRNKIINDLSESYVYINSYNDDNDNIVTLNFYDDGEPPTFAFSSGEVITPCPFQVRIRDTSFENAWDRAKAIRELLKFYKYQVIVIKARSNILTMGNDEKSRSILTINFDMELIEGNTVT